jgi:hypothetical protein
VLERITNEDRPMKMCGIEDRVSSGDPSSSSSKRSNKYHTVGDHA